MRYTLVQYTDMVETVQSAIMQAELHNGRIVKRLEGHEKKQAELHKRLQEELLKAVGTISEIEVILWHGETT